MPVRIYALAKQLKLDSKTMVDICTQAGVGGKGSALASLTDEEVDTVQSYISTGGGAIPAAKAGIASPQRPGTLSSTPGETIRREDYLGPGGTIAGKIPVLPGKPSAPKTLKPASSPEVHEIAPAPPEPPEPQKPATPEQESAPSPERPKIVPAKPKAPPSKKPRTATPERTSPTIKLAPLPAAQSSIPKAREPAAQKPDIKLPRDAIRAGRLGEKPLSKHIEKHEKKRKEAAKKPLAKPGEKRLDKAIPGSSLSAERARRGARAPAQDSDAAPLGGREQRQIKRKRSTTRRRKSSDPEEARGGRQGFRRIRRTGTNTAAPRKSNVVMELPCTIRTFSEAIGVSASRVLAKLLTLGASTGMNINAELDPEMAELLAAELGVEVDFRRHVELEQQLLPELEHEEEDPALLEPRPPVITFLGHVDHGKTSLLDRIIGIDVVSGEKGGITQHIRAYRIEKDGRVIAFVDTPGHEAFTAMRARGANVTDIAVLVVAADDGVMPQTEEAISHARAAGVPIVVALNKIDLPGVDLERIYAQLAENGLLPSQWSGDTEVIPTSAITGQGVDELLDTLLTVAELHEYKANPNRPAFGTCLESELHEGRGVVAKFLVEKGTLHVGDVVVCGSSYGRVKAMYDTLNGRKKHEQAGPSTPVNLTGLNAPPGAGDRFHVVPEIVQAREIAEHRGEQARQESLSGGRVHVTLENLFERLGEREDVQTLNIILRADVRGSIEAIRKELTKLEHPEVQIRILQATVGGVTEADVHLADASYADASQAVIIGFNVVPDEGARQLAEQRGVQIRRYDIIYQITDDLRAALEGKLKPEKREAELGRALVQRTFQISRLGTIAGCRVLAGTIERDARVRVIRESRVIGEYPLESLRREKDDTREIREGFECGMKLRGFNDLKEGDILEAYKIEEIARTF